jgi:hypothetical protein
MCWTRTLRFTYSWVLCFLVPYRRGVRGWGGHGGCWVGGLGYECCRWPPALFLASEAGFTTGWTPSWVQILLCGDRGLIGCQQALRPAWTCLPCGPPMCLVLWGHLCTSMVQVQQAPVSAEIKAHTRLARPQKASCACWHNRTLLGRITVVTVSIPVT